ncbi:hypothetical protein [Halalkalibacter akibai]|uniref:ParB/Sulfiredoxin domain-containing protein n=1 Tax=Halalkalibacter akibai (strain ATCC 43226 / DSM 21942 / CIP 109018 / JCM 9157 / 1139) TaxID=1236973 RepID=W4R172_HALA3|nr:hypothetical protein [Halalkalibacter akibai]GAE37648.1 hypothetical protein JCM9157_4965 [Halalkalibacter akibai JCM 9157]
MKEEIIMIPLKNIQPLYDAYISSSFLTRMQLTANQIETYDLILPVEKHVRAGKYVLVGGYDKYRYMKEQNYQKAPCIIEKKTSSIKQNLKVMRRLHNKGDSWSRDNKLKLLEMLRHLSPISLKTLITHTGFKRNELERLNYHPAVPEHYRSEQATTSTLNWIATHKAFSPRIKEFLYNRALLKISDHKRLTHEKMKTIDFILKKLKPHSFEMLTEDQQRKVLTRCMNFKGVMVISIQKMIDDYLKN